MLAAEQEEHFMILHFRRKDLTQLHEDGSAKGVPFAMADKLRKLLFALETAETLEQVGRFPGLEAASSEGRPERIVEPDGHGKLAADFPLRRTDQHRQRY
jgi:hypothetical protein